MKAYPAYEIGRIGGIYNRMRKKRHFLDLPLSFHLLLRLHFHVCVCFHSNMIIIIFVPLGTCWHYMTICGQICAVYLDTSIERKHINKHRFIWHSSDVMMMMSQNQTYTKTYKTFKSHGVALCRSHGGQCGGDATAALIGSYFLI